MNYKFTEAEVKAFKEKMLKDMLDSMKMQADEFFAQYVQGN